MEFADYIEILKALGENTRFRIFEMLRNGTPVSYTHLTLPTIP